MPAALPLNLDDWLPAPQVCTRHRRTAAASADDVWAAASEVRVDETGTLGRVVHWRIPGLPAGETFRGMLASPPFTVLAEGEHWSVSGLVGRIWTLRRDYPRVPDADAFAAWDQRGTARVLFAHWVESASDGRSALVSEARVAAVDRHAAVRLRALWAVVGPFERLIGGEALRLVTRRAEQRG
jgi:hypothetical protein